MKELMERVISELTDQNAEADLIYHSSRSLKMSAQKGALSEYKVSSSQILGVRVIKEGRVGISYTEAMDEESLSLLIRQALENAQASEPNPFEAILDLSGELNDEAYYPEGAVDIREKTDLALELERAPRERDKRVTAVPYNSYSENESQALYLSSRGRFTSFADKSYGITTSALMDDLGKKAMFYDYQMTHTFKELNPAEVIQNSVFHASNILMEQVIPTGKYAVLFDIDSLKDLVECFSNFFSAKSALDKLNPWANRLGDEVISRDLTIIDDPLFPEAFRVTRFDAEGVAAKPLTLVNNGTLTSLLHNSSTAKQFKTHTTGHAYRSPGSSLGISGSHFIIRGENVRPLPQRYLEVIQMDGLHSGANRVTGNFSVGVKGYIWENGERVGTFGNVTLSGNLMELLSKATVTGQKLESSTSRSFFSVPLVFEGMSIAGS